MSLAIPAVGPAVVTLGVFDGVHRGHRHVVSRTVEAARRLEARSVAVVFDPPPIELTRPGTTVARLLPLEMVLEQLRLAEVDMPLVVRFDDDVRQMSPEAFLAALSPGIELRAIAMTPDSAFGHDRAGTLDRVRQIGLERGFETISVEPLLVDGGRVSSTRIREALAAGDVRLAARLLGRSPLLRGQVVHGDGRGRELGFPTANLAFDYNAALPALGIYLGRVSVPERGVGPGAAALVSVGVRPTFHDAAHVLVEAYLLDFQGDLYGATLTLELGPRLREELRFESVDALVEQMRQDEADARRAFGSMAGERFGW